METPSQPQLERSATKAEPGLWLQKVPKLALIGSLIIALAMVVGAVVVIYGVLSTSPADFHAGQYKFALDVFKVVIAGAVVSILGIVIPLMVSEANSRFERMKASRIAYSEAKTGLVYLKLRLAKMKLAEAAQLVQHVHFNKHQAELYEELLVHLHRRFGPDMTMQKWDWMMYHQLFFVRQLLEQNVSTWDDMTPKHRLELLEPVLPTLFELDDEEVKVARAVLTEYRYIK